jgi:hypothetical protein
MGLCTSSECSKFTLKDTHTYGEPTRRGTSRYKLAAAGGLGEGLWPDSVAHGLVFLGSIINVDYTD